MTLSFFALSGLDLLDAIEEVAEQREAYIDWIYQRQLGGWFARFLQLGDRNVTDKFADLVQGGGFSNSCSNSKSDLTSGDLPTTYSALACLAILSDDLSRLDRKALIQFLDHAHESQGNYEPRMIYCLCANSIMIGRSLLTDAKSFSTYLESCQVSNSVWIEFSC